MAYLLFRLLFIPAIALIAYRITEWLTGNDCFHEPNAIGSCTVLSGTVGLLAAIVPAYLLAREITSRLGSLAQQIRDFPSGVPSILAGRSSLPPILELESAIWGFLNDMKDQIKDLRLEKELLSSLLNGLQEGVLCINSEGTVLFQNRAIDTDLVERDSVGRPYFRAVRNPVMLERINERIRVILPEGTSATRSARTAEQAMQENSSIAFRQGQKHFKMIGHPIVMEDRLELFLIILRDDTQEENTKRLREDFLQNASHELKTPITSIRGYAETILYRTVEDRDRKFLNAILRNVERMERIIEDMVTISSLESGAFPFHPEPMPLRDFMERIMELVEGLLKQKMQTLRIHIEPADLTIRADPLLMEHLLINLVANASRYSPPSGSIDVRVRNHPNGRALLSVVDDGPGVEEPYREKIFERFFRADKNRSRSEGGTGLGLSIVRQITRIHGGEVRVENEPGRGASFQVLLPME